MPSRFTFAAMALAAPLLLAACERGAQQAETGQAEAPPAQAPAEPPAAAEAPPAAEPTAQAAAEPPADGAPAAAAPSAAERQAAQAEDGRPAMPAPGEPSPEAAGVASVAAYVGRWAEDAETCERSFWTFTNLRLQSPNGEVCDILSTEAQQDGVAFEVACTDQDRPLAEPRRDTMSLTFPNLPQTDAMAVRGGPAQDEELSLGRCPLG